MIIGFLATSIGTHAQEEANGKGDISGPELVWSKTYGEHRIDILAGIAQRQDGGYVAAMTRLYYDPVEATYQQVHKDEPGGIILLTKIDSEGNKIWEKDYGDSDKLYRTVIPRNVRLAEAPSFGKPVISYDMQSKGAQAYLALAGEMLRRAEKAAA